MALLWKRNTLEAAHRSVGRLAATGSHLLAAVLLLGSLFSVLTVGVRQALPMPEAWCRGQAFWFNYTEFSEVEKRFSLPRPATKTSASTGKPEDDPNWDGALAGFSLGVTLGRNIPLVGWLIGPLGGLMIGYQVDSRI